MNNDKICPNCGITNQLGSNFCAYCGTKLTFNSIQGNQQNTSSNIEEIDQVSTDDSKGTLLGFLSLILYFGSPIVVSIVCSLLPASIQDRFSTSGASGVLVGLVIMVIGRVKYPTNKLLKAVMWSIIVSTIIGTIAVAIFLLWCFATCSEFKGLY